MVIVFFLLVIVKFKNSKKKERNFSLRPFGIKKINQFKSEKNIFNTSYDKFGCLFPPSFHKETFLGYHSECHN